MRELMKDAGLPEPIFSTKDFFIVTFMKRVEPRGANSGTFNGALNDRLNLSNTEKTIVDIIGSNPDVSRSKLVEASKISVSSIKRGISSLSSKGIIIYHGSKKTGGYY